MSRKLLLKGGIWLTAGNAISALAGFLRNILIARFVSVEDFGIASLLALTMSIVEMASNLAIDRLLVQAPDGNEPRLQATGQAFQAVRGLLGGLILYITAKFVADFFKVPHAAWAFQCLALVPVIRGFVHLDIVRYQREMHFAPSVWADALPQLISLAIAVPLAIWLGDFSVMVWVIIAQSMCYLVFSYALAERPYQWAWDKAILSRMIAFGWPLLINGLLMFIIFQGDKAIVGSAFSMQVLGWYSAAFTLTLAPAILVTKAAQSLLLPILSRAQADQQVFFRQYPIVIQGCLLMGLLMGVAFAAFGPELLILLFGQRYQDGVKVVVLLGITQGIRVAKSGPMIVAMSRAETKNPLLSNLVRGVSLLLAIGAVSMHWGIFWIAMAGLLGELLAYMISLKLLRTRLELEIRQFFLPVMICMGVFVAIFFASEMIRQECVGLLKLALLSGLALIAACIGFVSMSTATNQLLQMFRAKLQAPDGFDDHESSQGIKMKALVFTEKHMAWARKMDRRTYSSFAGLISNAYRVRTFRRMCLWLIPILEGGHFFSKTLRRLLEKYHGVRVGQYSYGSCLVPGKLPRGTTVGAYCSFADGIRVFRRNHPVDVLSQHPFFYNSLLGLVPKDTINSNEDNPLTIGNDVWIGDGVTILPGCKSIGNGAIIGAGSVVTRNVEAFNIVAGNPAKVIKRRFGEDIEKLISQSRWWDMPLPDLLRADMLLIEKVGEAGLIAFVDALKRSGMDDE